jgi:hypothetical protein
MKKENDDNRSIKSTSGNNTNDVAIGNTNALIQESYDFQVKFINGYTVEDRKIIDNDKWKTSQRFEELSKQTFNFGGKTVKLSLSNEDYEYASNQSIRLFISDWGNTIPFIIAYDPAYKEESKSLEYYKLTDKEKAILPVKELMGRIDRAVQRAEDIKNAPIFIVVTEGIWPKRIFLM